MSTIRFLIVALTGGVVAATLLALAAALDAPILYLPALLAVLAILAAREGWLWAGDLRGWMLMLGTLAATTLIAFVSHRVGS